MRDSDTRPVMVIRQNEPVCGMMPDARPSGIAPPTIPQMVRMDRVVGQLFPEPEFKTRHGRAVRLRARGMCVADTLLRPDMPGDLMNVVGVHARQADAQSYAADRQARLRSVPDSQKEA